MNHELLMLRSLLVASVLVCALILGNMLSYSGNPIQLARAGSAVSAAASCALPPGGIICPRSGS